MAKATIGGNIGNRSVDLVACNRRGVPKDRRAVWSTRAYVAVQQTCYEDAPRGLTVNRISCRHPRHDGSAIGVSSNEVTLPP